MFIEFRFATDHFLSMVRDGLISQLPAVTDDFLDPASGTRLWIDHIVIDPLSLSATQSEAPPHEARGMSGGKEYVRRRRVLVNIPVRIHLVRPDDVAAAGPDAAPVFKLLAVTYVAEVTASVYYAFVGIGARWPAPKGSVRLDFKIVDVDATSPLREALLQAMRAIPFPPLEVPLTAVYEARGAVAAASADPPVDLYPDLVGAGIFAAHAKVFSVMVELAPEGRDSAHFWTQFYAGEGVFLPPANDWAAVLGHDIMVRPIVQAIEQGIQDDGQIKLTHMPEGTLANIGDDFSTTTIPSGARLTIGFQGNVVRAEERTLPKAIGIKAVITVDMTVEGDKLRLHIRVSYDLDDFDVALNAVMAGLLGTFLGELTGMLIIPMGPALGGMVGGIAGFVGVIVIASGMPAQIPSSALTKFECEAATNPAERICRMPLATAIPGGGKVKLETVGTVPPGKLLVGGSMLLPRVVASILTIEQPIEPFNWMPLGKDAAGEYLLGIEAFVGLSLSGGTQLRVGRLEALGPQKFTLTIEPAGNGALLKISAEPGADYWAAPPPCRIYIHTNAGVRIFELPAPVRPSDSEIERRLKLFKQAWEKSRLIDLDRFQWGGGGLPIGVYDSRRLWIALLEPVDLISRRVAETRDAITASHATSETILREVSTATQRAGAASDHLARAANFVGVALVVASLVIAAVMVFAR